MHRNSQKRYYGDYIYSITCNVQDRVPFFQEKKFCDIWLENLKITKYLKKFELYAFCLNYDHFHLLLKPDERFSNISEIIQALKKNVSQDINKFVFYNNPSNVGANSNSRMQNVGNDFNVNANMGNKFSSNVDDNNPSNVGANSNSRLQNMGEIRNQNQKFQRQKSFHDHIIRNEKDFLVHLKYVEFNYLKHNLPENRKYTSNKTKKL